MNDQKRRDEFTKFANELIENKGRWIGAQLIDSGDLIDQRLDDHPGVRRVTEVTDIGFDPNQKTFLWIEGKEFSCGVHIDYGSIDDSQTNEDLIVFNGYMGHVFQIRKP